MDILKLEAKKREVTGKQVKKIRLAKKLPAAIYGKGEPNQNLEIDAAEFDKTYKQTGESTLIDLSVDGKAPLKVLIQDVQHDPLLNQVTHVDFRQVNMKEKLEVAVSLKFIGEAPAVKEQGAVLVRNMNEVRVRALPGDLIHEIEIDLSKLKNLNEMIRVKDIVPPPGIELIGRPEDIIIVANEPMTEAEMAALEEKPVEDVGTVKVETEEKKAAKEVEEKVEPAKKEGKKE